AIDAANHRWMNAAMERRRRRRKRHRRARLPWPDDAEVGPIVEHDVMRYGVVVRPDDRITDVRLDWVRRVRARAERTDDRNDHLHRRWWSWRRVGRSRRRRIRGRHWIIERTNRSAACPRRRGRCKRGR